MLSLVRLTLPHPHSHTLQYIPLRLHCAVAYTYACPYAFSHSIPIHCSTYPYVFTLLLIRLMPVFLCLQPQYSHTLQYMPFDYNVLFIKTTLFPMPSNL